MATGLFALQINARLHSYARYDFSVKVPIFMLYGFSVNIILLAFKLHLILVVLDTAHINLPMSQKTWVRISYFSQYVFVKCLVLTKRITNIIEKEYNFFYMLSVTFV